MIKDVISSILPGLKKNEIEKRLGVSLNSKYLHHIERDMPYCLGSGRSFDLFSMYWLLIHLDAIMRIRVIGLSYIIRVGLAEELKTIFLFLLLISCEESNVKNSKDCVYETKISKMGGHKVLVYKDFEISDITGLRVIDNILFFSTSPIYGKPEVGAINCQTEKRYNLIKAKNITKGYMDGSDYFKIKSVKKIPGGYGYKVFYYYIADIDNGEMKKIKTLSNLKMIKFSIKD